MDEDEYAYCDECGYACDGRYHDYLDCGECGAEASVEVFRASANPEDGDEWQCEECGAGGPW